MISEEQQPTIPHHQSLPEITIKGTIVAIILTVLLAASNVYLGLKVGLTISASIPAAILSMSILRWFKNYNVLENNIVQTCVSCGEGMAAGVIYSIPALLILKYWFHFDYWNTVIISILGGLLGVLFSIPLRKVLLSDKTLKFPEGVAIGKVLQASSEGVTHGSRYLLGGGIVGALISFFQQGLQIMTDSVGLWFNAGKMFYGIGIGFSPALIAAGYIIGITSAVSIFIGIIVAWIIGTPILSIHFGDMVGQGTSAVMELWSRHIRYMGVGTLMIGGLWTIIKLIKPIAVGIHTAVSSVNTNHNDTIRTERDMNIKKVFWSVSAVMIPVVFVIWHFISAADLGLSNSMAVLLLVVTSVMVLILSFVVTALCGYFSGLVGATNNPLSAMAISSVILIALVMLALLTPVLHGHINNMRVDAIAIVVLAIIACAGAISADTMQDLKAGQIVGATPWKQQVMLFLGVIVAAFVVPPILNLLLNAYGIGDIFPRPGMDHANVLVAPQATLMANIVSGILGKGLNWSMIIIGMVIGAICVVIDEIISRRGYRVYALAVGLGIYLPIMTASCLVIGGFISYFADKKLKKIIDTDEIIEHAHDGNQRATLLACGLVAGATLMGVLLAVPFVIYKSSDIIAIMPAAWTGLAEILGAISAALICWWLYSAAVKK